MAEKGAIVTGSKKRADPAETESAQAVGLEPTGGSLARREDPQAQLARLDRDAFNVLQPVISVEGDAVSPLLVSSIQFVRVNADEKAGDTYHDPRFAPLWTDDGKLVPAKTRYALTAQAIGRIAAAAGVKWIPEQTCMVPGSRERRANGHVYLRYKATGAIRQPNGEWYWEPVEVEIDTQDEAEEIAATYRRQIRDGRNKYLYGKNRGKVRFVEDDVPDMVEREIMQLRRFILRHAETKAKSRAIRRLLSLPQTFSHDEISRPFAVPRLLYRPDFADPMQLEQAQISGQRAERGLYGGLPELGPELGTTSPTGPAGAGVEPSSSTDEVGEEGEAGTPEDPVHEIGPLKGKRFSELVTTDKGRKALEDVRENAPRPKLRALAKYWLEKPSAVVESDPSGGPAPAAGGEPAPAGVEPHPFVGEEGEGCTVEGCGYAAENPVHAGQSELLPQTASGKRRSLQGH
jgi:hypothetical protein